MDNRDIILGLDSGTSVVKAVAFDLEGEQIECASVRNSYSRSAGGAAQQSMEQTWQDAVVSIRKLTERVENLAERVVAIAVTGQGDGTGWWATKTARSMTPGFGWTPAPRLPLRLFRAHRWRVRALKQREQG